MNIKNRMRDELRPFILKSFRNVCIKMHLVNPHFLPYREMDQTLSNDAIYDMLSSGKPCMIARYGSAELERIVEYMGVRDVKRSALRYILCQMPKFWWSKECLEGVNNLDRKCKYGQICLDDSYDVDILGSWCKNEKWLRDGGYLSKQVFYTSLIGLEPWWGQRPWSRFLKGKRVLVIHMFKDTIEEQYFNHRAELFPQNPELLPEFASLRVIKGLFFTDVIKQGLFTDWFDILEYFKNEMDKEPYDVVLLGCGSVGFNLAAYAKRTGHQAIHLGGALQLLFGIKGHRWENPEFGKISIGKKNAYVSDLFNSSWVYPHDYEISKLADLEHGCYIKSGDSKY